MTQTRYTRPDTATLMLANGDTLVVKRRLNSAESRHMKAMQATPTLADAAVVMAYLVGWSLVKLDGTPDPIEGLPALEVANRLDALEEAEFDEIAAAVNTHRQAMVAERDAQKKIRDGEPASSRTSPSPFAPV